MTMTDERVAQVAHSLCECENLPHAGTLVEALRNVGYSEEEAIGEFVDDSLDAGAKHIQISIGLAQGENLPAITVWDDGVGMDHATLDEALRFGSHTERDPSTDLGLYGMGLTTAAFALGRELQVITQVIGGTSLMGRISLDEIQQQDKFVKSLGAGPAVRGQKHFRSVEVRRCDRVVSRNMDELANRVRRWLGEIYRWFLLNGRSISVNGVGVEPWDPLMLDRNDTRKIYDQRHMLHARSLTDGAMRDFEVWVRASLLPDLGVGENRELGIHVRNQGYFVLRNYRQIERAQRFDVFEQHNTMNRFRGEIYLPGEMDPGVGAHFTKRGITYSQSIIDQLKQILVPIDRSWGTQLREEMSRKRAKEEAPKTQVSHRAAVATIKRKAPALLKPGLSEKATNDGKPRRRALGRFTPRFEDVALSSSGPMWDRAIDEEGLIIRYNMDHPFYARFLLGQPPKVVEAVDLLVFSQCLAEMEFTEERTGVNTEGLVRAFRVMMSMNMGLLLDN